MLIVFCKLLVVTTKIISLEICIMYKIAVSLLLHYLVQTLGLQVDQCSEDAGRKWLSRLLDAQKQRNPKDPPAFHVHHLGLPQLFRNSPADDRYIH